MKQILSTALTILASLFLVAGASYGKDLVNVAGESGVALSGYDPVAFFTAKKPMNGDPSIKAEHQGATYFFSSKKNRSLFKKSPNSYAPQHGGYCAFGATLNALFPVEIDTWQIVNGKLYLNLNPEIVKAFNKNRDKNIAKADKNWTKLVQKHGK